MSGVGEDAAGIGQAALLLASGRIGYSQAVTGRGVREHNNALSVGTNLRGNLMTFLSDSYFRQSTFRRDVTLVHEAYHYLFPNWDDEVAIEAMATRVVRYYFFCGAAGC